MIKKLKTKTTETTKRQATDKYQQLNDQLIKLLEQDLPPWRQDWLELVLKVGLNLSLYDTLNLYT